jgi:hypothetical protein
MRRWDDRKSTGNWGGNARHESNLGSPYTQ